MYSIALGPICFKWMMPSLSGPKALLFPQLLIALLTRPAVNDCAISKDFLLVSLVTNRVSPEEVRLHSFDVLNCWLNLAACMNLTIVLSSHPISLLVQVPRGVCVVQ